MQMPGIRSHPAGLERSAIGASVPVDRSIPDFARLQPGCACHRIGADRIKRASIVLRKRKTSENTDRGCKRHRNQEADESKQISKGEQSKHHPNRTQVDTSADEIW